jgi:hypothetical protein
MTTIAEMEEFLLKARVKRIGIITEMEDLRKTVEANAPELKRHKDAIREAHEQSDKATAEACAMVEKLQKEIEETEAFYDKAAHAHHEPMSTLELPERKLNGMSTRLAQMEEHLKVLELQAQGWVIFSVGGLGFRKQLGQRKRTNFHPNGCYIVDIVAKPSGIYIKTDTAQSYVSVEGPGKSDIVMVRPEHLLKTKISNGPHTGLETVCGIGKDAPTKTFKQVWKN